MGKTVLSFMAHDVFVCYSSEDKTIANAACAKLESAGIRCWIAPRDPIAGIPYGRQLVEAITAARVVLLIFSGNANRSEHVLRELEVASDSGKIIVPFRIENVTPSGDLRYYITRVHWLDAMSPPMEARLNELVTLMQRLLDMPIAPAAATNVAPAPVAPRKGYPVAIGLLAIAAAVAIALGVYFARRHSATPPMSNVAKAPPTLKPTTKPVRSKIIATYAPVVAPPPTPRVVYISQPAAPKVNAPTPVAPRPTKTAAPRKSTPRPTSSPAPEVAAHPPVSVQYRTPRGRSFFIRHLRGSNWHIGTATYTTVGRANVGGTAGTTLVGPNGREWLFVPDIGASGSYAQDVCFSLAGPGLCDANKTFPIVFAQ